MAVRNACTVSRWASLSVPTHSASITRMQQLDVELRLVSRGFKFQVPGWQAQTCNLELGA